MNLSLTSFLSPLKKSGKFTFRQYRSYGAYLAHQRSKLATLDLTRHDKKFAAFLREHLVEFPFTPPSSVLCLASRSGIEVAVFRELGHFAWGIDLLPSKENEYVTYGDFHDLKLASESVDVVYTNSLDHSLEPQRLANEVYRVLKPGGQFLLESTFQVPSSYEAFGWEKTKDILEIFSKFSLVERRPFTGWGKKKPPGEFILFKK